MTAMRLHRYPSASSGIALGKMGVGATMMRNILPAGARWVEYLESTGTQWIDTGVNAKQSLKIRAMFERYDNTPYFAYGVRAGNSTITCATEGLVRWGESAYADAIHATRVDITQDSCGIIVNGASYLYNATQTVVEQSGYTMVIFAGRNSTTTITANMVGKFYSFEIWDNGVLVRSFAPIAIGTTGYMLDLVTGDYLPYGNAGTGDFVIGPDINAPAI